MGILSVLGGRGEYFKHIFLIYANHLEKWDVQPTGQRKPFYVRVQWGKKNSRATTNHKVDLNLQNSFCFIYWLACPLLF